MDGVIVTDAMIAAGMRELALGYASAVWEISAAELAAIYTAMHRTASRSVPAVDPAMSGSTPVSGNER
jgi:hypothetical protein